MGINWKRYMLGALLLASLSLLLFGCGDYGSDQTAQNGSVTKSVSGVVSGDDGLPVANATVTAYAVDANGVQSTTPLSVNPASATSDANGVYRLFIPESYQGAVILEATLPPARLLDRLAKMLFAAGDRKMKSALPERYLDSASVPPVMISFATNAVVQFIELNAINAASPAQGFSATGFSSDNIAKATFVMEAFFGAYFSQLPPPANAAQLTSSTNAQQNLVVMTRALAALAANPGTPITMAQIVTGIATTGLGEETADQIRRSVTAISLALSASGALPAEYLPSQSANTALANATYAPLTPPALTDNGAPGAPGSLGASALDARTVSLTWSLSVDEGSGASGVAGYLVYRSDVSTPYLAIDTVPGAEATSYTDVTAAPATQYSYKVVAFDGARNLSLPSNVATLRTPAQANAADSAPPATPAGLVCRGYSDRQINLQWLQSTDLGSDGALIPASGYKVYRDWQVVAVVSEASYIDTDVTPGTQYSYYVKAFDANANISAASATLNVRSAAAAGTTPPAPPGALALESAQYDRVALTWSASPSAGVSYNVYRGAQLIAAGISSTRYSDSTVTANSSYLYTVTAQNADGESGAGNVLSVTVPANPDPGAAQTAPTVPTNLVLAVPATANSVPLIWSPSTKGDGDRIVAGYDVLRAQDSGSFQVIATVRFPGFTDTSVAPSTSYSYQVRSFSSSGTRSAVSTPPLVVGTGQAVDVSDTTPPSAPANLSGSATANAVALTWSASMKSTGDGIVAGYRVYRNGVQIAAVTPQSASAATVGYIDNSVQAGTGYSYTVKAFDNPGNLSQTSNEFSVTTPAQAPNTNTISGRVTLNGIGLPGVVVNITGDGTGSFVTDANGYYSGPVLYGNYTLTPSAPGYVFTPASKSVAVNSLNSPVQNFSALFTGSVSGGTTFPGGSAGVVMTYPNGTVIGGVSYPPGTIIGGVSYPSGAVIGGVTYPTATVIGGVTYPTGTVLGGVLYPNGVVIGGVSYPPGTIVGGVAFPVGAVTAGITIPTGTLIGGVTYPNGAVVGGVSYPAGTIIGGVTYPNGSVAGGIALPSGTVVGSGNYPAGTVVGGVTFPSGAVIGGVSYPTGIVAGAATFPTGSASVVVSYPVGALFGGTSYPAGTIVGGVSYPNGSNSATVIGGITYPTGSVLGGVSYPTGVVLGGVSYPAGTVVGGVAFPIGAATAGFSFPTGAVLGAGDFPTGSVIGGVTYPSGVVSGGVAFGGGAISILTGTLLFP